MIKLTNFKTITLMLSASALLALNGCGSTGESSDSGFGDTTTPVAPAPVDPAPVDPAPVLDTTPPVFASSDAVSVNENQTSAITLVATDTSTVTYSIGGTDAGSFSVDASTGIVTFNTAPDYETKSSYTFTATATDTSSNATTQTVTITILDIVCEGAVTHNGEDYCTVVSPYTGKVWLDRNLGAARVCTQLDDTACYGDYYQWGRNFDGHQDSTSGTTATQAADINNAGSEFILSSVTYDRDWAQAADSNGSLRAANWSQTGGSSVCPAGFRVPTAAELGAELLDAGSAEIQNATDAFNSFLKLPSAGLRTLGSGDMTGEGRFGTVFSSSASGSDATELRFRDDNGTLPDLADLNDKGRAFGESVRCLKD